MATERKEAESGNVAEQEREPVSDQGRESAAKQEAESPVETLEAAVPESGAGAGAQAPEVDPTEKLKAELERSRTEAAQHWDQFVRAQAELENVRRRAERDVSNAHKYALEKFCAALLPVVDSLEMGVAAAREESDGSGKLLEGSELTLKMFQDVLAKFALVAVDPAGGRFDPQEHEAMATQPTAEAEPNTVLHVVQKGYKLSGRLIRPAMVIVARAPEAG
jgi:molecular chaperone GrpE